MNEAYPLVALGGALGSMARYGLAAMVAALTGPAFPWGTLLINVTGSFIIGLFATLHASLGMKAFVMVGICGGFTTFSSFSLQTLELARGGKLLRAAMYVLSSAGLCLAFVWLGTQI